MNISVAIVAYNAEKTLPRLLDDLVAQDYPHEKIEILLIDSMSTDRTRSIMEHFSCEDYGYLRVVVLENPGKVLPCGCNVILEYYTGEAIVRLDAHSSIPSNFISQNICCLEEGEDICGGPVESILVNDTPIQQTMLIAENSVFCGGAAGFRRLEERAYVSTLAFGFYRRCVYDDAGLYDERLSRTEDNDMSYRIRQCGYRFCLDPRIRSFRFSRSSLGKLLKQKYLNGYWIGKTMGVNPKCFSLYHFVPFAFVLGIIFTTILAAFDYPLLSMLMWGAYLLVDLGVTLMECTKNDFYMTNLLLPILFLLLHLSYGIGTLIGLLEMPFWLKEKKLVNEET